MKLMDKFSKRLNLNICPKTYDRLRQEASNQGRVTGNMARVILDRWAMDMNGDKQNGREKNMGA